MLCISFSWAILVDLYPSENRPYVGSSTSNSVIELIIDHNGVERISGTSTKINSSKPNNKNINSDDNNPNFNSGGHAPKDKHNLANSNNNISTNNSINPQPNNAPPNSLEVNSSNKNSSGGRDSISTPSILRLWSNELYGQISWLIIFCIFTMLSFIKKFRKNDLDFKFLYNVYILQLCWIFS